jgi:hypothetical protein
MLLGLQLSDSIETLENALGMGGVAQFFGEVLPCPMFIMVPIAPQSRCTYVVNYSLIRTPDFLPVLPVAKRQLCSCVFLHCKLLVRNLMITVIQQKIKNDLPGIF